MAEAATKTDEPAPEAEVIRKEHDVSIVLSFMNDEHEKAAIEVRTRVCLRRTRRGMWVGIIKRPGTNTVALSQSSSLDLGRGAKRGLTLWKKPNLHFPRRQRYLTPSFTHPHKKKPQEACLAFDKHTQYKDVAQHIKKGYDFRYPSSGKATDGVYHAVVGTYRAFPKSRLHVLSLTLVTVDQVIAIYKTDTFFYVSQAKTSARRFRTKPTSTSILKSTRRM
jgi:hypothetical protein